MHKRKRSVDVGHVIEDATVPADVDAQMRILIDKKKREIKPQLDAHLRRKRKFVKRQRELERDCLEVLRHCGSEPLKLNTALLLNNKLGIAVADYHLPKQCPGANDIRTKHDPRQFKSTLLISEANRAKGLTFPWIVNVTGTWLTGLQHINIQSCVHLLPDFQAHYNGRWPTMMQKTAYRYPVAGHLTSCLYETGKMVATGARTPDQMMTYAHALTVYMTERNLTCRVENFQIENLVCTVDFEFNIDLNAMKAEMRDELEYEPDDFPAAVFRLQEMGGAVALVNLSGKGVYVGHKELSGVEKMHEIVTALVSNYRKRDDQTISSAGYKHIKNVLRYNQQRQLLNTIEMTERLMGGTATENEKALFEYTADQLLDYTHSIQHLQLGYSQASTLPSLLDYPPTAVEIPQLLLYGI